MKLWSKISLFAIVFSIIGCSDTSNETPKDSVEQKEEVVYVYSSRHYPVDEELYAQFEKETGIKVMYKGDASADQLLEKIKMEGDLSDADLFLTSDAGRLYKAQQEGLFQAANSEVLNQQIPSNLRDDEGYWFGLTKRARIVVYSKDRVDSSMLSTYADLTNPKWKGKIAVRSSSNQYNQSLLAALTFHMGVEGAKEWAQGIVNNMCCEPKGNDRDQVKKVAAGDADLAIVNTYYLGKLLTSENEEERKAGEAVKVFFPDQGGNGAHVNISGGGVVKTAKNKENAVKLLEFLSSKSAQQKYASANFEYPVNPEVKASELVQSWGEFKGDTIKVDNIGAHLEDAVLIFSEVNWE